MIEFKTYSKKETFTIKTKETEVVLRFLATWKGMNVPLKTWKKFTQTNNIKYEVL